MYVRMLHNIYILTYIHQCMTICTITPAVCGEMKVWLLQLGISANCKVRQFD